VVEVERRRRKRLALFFLPLKLFGACFRGLEWNNCAIQLRERACEMTLESFS
jgi:hypothetical protein